MIISINSYLLIIGLIIYCYYYYLIMINEEKSKVIIQFLKCFNYDLEWFLYFIYLTFILSLIFILAPLELITIINKPEKRKNWKWF